MLGKIHSVKMGGSGRNIYPGFGKSETGNPPEGFDYDMWLGPAPKRPYQSHRGLYHFRWFWDYSGGQMTNLGAHSIDQLQYVMGVKGPTQVVSFGGRYALEDDGETPDLQEAIFTYPGWLMTMSVREANGYRDSTRGGTAILGTKGDLILGSNEIVSENKSNPVNLIPRFQGQQPVGGPQFDQTRPTPWIEGASAPAAGRNAGNAGRGGGAGAGAGAGRSGGADRSAAQANPAPAVPAGPGLIRNASNEEEMFNANKRDWVDCIKSRNRPFCDLESGNRVAITCNLANMSLRLGGRTLKWDPEKMQIVGDKEAAAMCVRQYRAPLGWRPEEPHQGIAGGVRASGGHPARDGRRADGMESSQYQENVILTRRDLVKTGR